MTDSNKPLLSYLLFTYNQEKYVREAVESAFAQTYSPLEIIISDDHSTDNTWEIIKELFNKYNGPHKVIINRNKQNLGIANHVNKVMSMAKGELFIMAAGDDIAFSKKAQSFYDAWLINPHEITAICSDFLIIDKNNNIIGKKEVKHPGLDQRDLYEIFKENDWSGCSVAYTKRLIKHFPKIKFNSEEDKPLFRRACLLGNVYRINEPLIYYRNEGISPNLNSNLPKIYKASKLTINGLLNFYYDVKYSNTPKADIKTYILITKMIVILILLLIKWKICMYIKFNPYFRSK